MTKNESFLGSHPHRKLRYESFKMIRFFLNMLKTKLFGEN